jgi:hypothetical protein
MSKFINDHHYTLTLGSNLDDHLCNLSEKLQITKAEVMSRALLLFKHAIVAKSVKLVFEDGTEQTVRIR